MKTIFQFYKARHCILVWLLNSFIISLNAQEDVRISIEIVSIGAEQVESSTTSVNGMKKIIFPSISEKNDHDIKIEITSTLKVNANNVWVFIKQNNSNLWRSYGYAIRDNKGFWNVPEVQIGTGVFQGREFVCRAALLDSNAPTILKNKGLYQDSMWISHALAISDPVEINVQSRKIIPDLLDTNFTTSQLWISTIDDQTVIQNASTVVNTGATISGTYSSMDLVRSPYIYILVHPVATDDWRAYGPAITNGHRWEVASVQIADPSQLHTTKYKISAVLSKFPLEIGSVNPNNWSNQLVVKSQDIEVSVRTFDIGFKQPRTIIQIEYADYLDSTGNIKSISFLPDSRLNIRILDSLGQIISFRGKYEGLAEGASIWLLGTWPGAPHFEILGKVMTNNDTWSLPVFFPNRFKTSPQERYTFQATASQNIFSLGILDYADLASKSLGYSPPIAIRVSPKAVVIDKSPEITILSIAGQEVGDAYISTNLMSAGQVEGKIIGKIPSAQVYVGIRPKYSNEWLFTGPAYINGSRWKIESLDFSSWAQVPVDSIMQLTVMAIITLDKLPRDHLQPEEISRYALATSPVVSLRSFTSSFLPEFGPWIDRFIWIIGVVLLLSLLFLFFKFMKEHLCKLARITGSLLGGIVDLLDVILNRLKEIFPAISNLDLDPRKTVIGLLVLGLELFAIYSYFPVYASSLQISYNLSENIAQSYALMVIILIALGGILFHIIFDWPNWVIKDTDKYYSTVRYLFLVIMAVFALVLWSIQGFTYGIYFKHKGDDKNFFPMILIAFLLGFTEWMGFFVATGMLTKFFGGILFYIIYAPVFIIKWLLKSIENIINHECKQE